VWHPLAQSIRPIAVAAMPATGVRVRVRVPSLDQVYCASPTVTCTSTMYAPCSPFPLTRDSRLGIRGLLEWFSNAPFAFQPSNRTTTMLISFLAPPLCRAVWPEFAPICHLRTSGAFVSCGVAQGRNAERGADRWGWEVDWKSNGTGTSACRCLAMAINAVSPGRVIADCGTVSQRGTGYRMLSRVIDESFASTAPTVVPSRPAEIRPMRYHDVTMQRCNAGAAHGSGVLWLIGEEAGTGTGSGTASSESGILRCRHPGFGLGVRAR
jgi:hypothetical protein